MSYALVEMMTWQGLGDVINRFREKSLGLEPVSLMWAPGMASRLRIPYTYCWYVTRECRARSSISLKPYTEWR